MEHNYPPAVARILIEENNKFEEEQLDLESLEQRKTLGYIGERKAEYKGSFTIHGLSRIYESRGVEKYIWLVIVIAAFVFVTYLLYEQISKYLRYESKTDSQIITTNQNIFPLIVFCDKHLLIHHFSQFQTDRQKCNQTVGSNCSIWKKWYCTDRASKACEESRFLEIRYGGACLVWNDKGTYVDVDPSIKTEIEMKYQTPDRNPKVVLFVKDPGTTFLDLADAMPLNEGQETFISIEKTVYRRLEKPYKNKCEKHSALQIFPGKYDRMACMNSVFLLHILKECGALPKPMMDILPPAVYKKYYRGISNLTEIGTCMRKNTGTYLEYSACPIACEESVYRVSLNEHRHNTDNKERQSYKFTIQFHLATPNSHRVIEETPSSKWDEMLAYVGGLIGLLIGASAISVVEVISFVYLCCWEKMIKRSMQKKITRQLSRYSSRSET